MKILHISSPTSWRGGEQQIQYMIDHQSKDHEVSLFSPKKSILSCKNKNLTRFDFKDGILASFSTARDLKRIHQKNEFDIIHAHDSKAHTILWMAYLINGLQARSVVHRRVDFNPNLSSRLKYNYPKISKIICVSDQVKKTLGTHIKDPSKLELIHSGVDLSIEKNNEILEGLSLPSGTFTIAIMAALTQEKRHDIFLAVANILLQNEHNIHFIIIGDGVLKNKIESYIRENQLEDFISLTGQVNDAKSKLIGINLILHAAEKEGLGTSLIEALNSKIPVVANRTGGIPEIVLDGYNGFLIDDNNIDDYVAVIKRLIVNQEEYAQLKGRSQSSVQKFDKEIMNGKIIAVYHNILNN